MGMHTEAFLRAHLKPETPEPLVTWFDQLANSDNAPVTPYDGHPFFTERGDRWIEMFFAAHACYQIARPFQFRRGERPGNRHELICHVSAKQPPVDEFVDWIRPWLAHLPGDFLGWTLYENSRPSDYSWGHVEDDREQPTLIYMPDRPTP